MEVLDLNWDQLTRWAINLVVNVTFSGIIQYALSMTFCTVLIWGQRSSSGDWPVASSFRACRSIELKGQTATSKATGHVVCSRPLQSSTRRHQQALMASDPFTLSGMETLPCTWTMSHMNTVWEYEQRRSRRSVKTCDKFSSLWRL